MSTKETYVKVDQVSKKYCKDLKRNMYYGLLDIMGFPKHNDLRKDEFWALKEISFELNRGDILGIMGKNGSGKTTLIKLITGIYALNGGSIEVTGKALPLFALKAGMHPYYTGRENIYIKGSIYGMNRKEIDKQLDAIIEFSELGQFIDAPFGTYSSGMKARLGFSVAIAANPEVFIVDEGLAVGDASFKQKCFEKMREIAADKAIIFVSSNPERVANIANKILVLNKGTKEYETDNVEEGISYYMTEIIGEENPNRSMKGGGQ